MTKPSYYKPNPKFDLVLERVIDVPPEMVWMVWTQPEHLKPWFCPRPWKTTEVRIDLRPGGEFFSQMEGPNGEVHGNPGCYLDVVPNERLVWTSTMEGGFRPAPPAPEGDGCDSFHMTAMLLLEPHGENGTKYTAIAMHSDQASAEKHRAMGFEQGWGTCLDQLVEYVKAL